MPLTLSIEAQDIALNALDADPSTPADFTAGRWTGYEDAFGNALDEGGTDCTLTTFARTAASQAAPPAPLACKAAVVVAPPPPPPPPPPPTSSGGGGGGGGAFGPLLVFLLLRRTLRRP